jgi:glycosyltransferase 2 family protein
MAILLAVGLPISGLLLFLAVRGAHLSRVAETLADANAPGVAAAVLALAAVYVLQAERWRVLAARRLPLASHLGLVVAAVAVNNVLPGRLGDVLRSRWLAVDARLQGGRALATVVLDRGADLVTLVVMFLCVLPFVTRVGWVDRLAVGGIAAAVLLGVLWASARAYTSRRPHGRVPAPSRGRVRAVIRDTLDGVSGGVDPGGIAVAVLLSVLVWAFWAAAAWLVARSLGISLGLTETLFITAAMNLGVAVPSSPGFVGAYQWLAVETLSLFEVGREEALAFSILMQAAWYLPTTVAGGALVLRRLLRGARPATATNRG